ncbi:hypothetical protein M3Y94_00525300 [Aphelenchoides besseyi]|nr:hypothetical protein M3Y94_00525300 [Aphelenchoides besseyi]KAI6225933.1 hypothetical protein M3Y95_00749100 [Aphelenchoides besseyi]
MDQSTTTYKCSACAFTFENLDLMLRHLTNLCADSFHQEPTFECVECNLTELECQELASHLSTVHLNINPCTSTAQPIDSAQRSQSTTNFDCSDCDLSFNSAAKLKKHQTTHDDQKLFACSKCNARFKRKSNLVQHSGVHSRSSANSLRCSMCEKTFLSRSALKLHFRIHTNTKPFACVFNGCSEHFRTRNLMNSHVNRQHLGLSTTNKTEYSATEAQRLVRRIAELSGKTINEDPPLKKSKTSAFSAFSLKRVEVDRVRQLGCASLDQNYASIYQNQIQSVQPLQRRAESGGFPFAPSDYRNTSN